MYGILLNKHDNPIELYMCLDLWSDDLNQKAIWDQKEHAVGTGWGMSRLNLKVVLLMQLVSGDKHRI